MKANKDEIIRARCTRDLKRDIQRIAEMQGVDEADVLRIACRSYVQKFKQPEAFLNA